MRKRANPDSEANIRRIDSKARALKQTHGFQVHFLRGQEVVTKMFSDTIYGGKESARRAARKFKRAAMLELPARLFRGPQRTDKQRAAAKAKVAPKKSSAKPKASAKRASARPAKVASKAKSVGRSKAKAKSAASSKRTGKARRR